ncbi:hypothetical protein B0H11DRAFT_2403206 [Mycena galericulata]|nr:hypothetical protein B0H11DRAFT_2403206 [Mycena galericulata]
MTYEVSPFFEPFGWVGLGFGGRMQDTHMVVLWESKDGSPILSQRYGIGHVEPVIESNPPRVASMVPPTVTSWRKGNYSTTAFQIPVNKTDPWPGRIIWAYSLRQPDSDPSADLTGHYVAGTVNMRLDKPILEPTLEIEQPEDDTFDPLPRVQKLIWHGFLLSVGFLVLLPTGSLVARWGRTFTPRWFKAHRVLNFGVALPVIAGGFVLGLLAVFDRRAAHLSDAHQICGVLLFALYVTQLALGRRAPHPPANVLHAVLGLSIVALAFFQVRSGFGEWSRSTGQPDVARWCRDALVGWVVVVPALYFTGLVLLRRQFAQEQQGVTYDEVEGKNYIALASAASPLLYDAERDISGYSELETSM